MSCAASDAVRGGPVSFPPPGYDYDKTTAENYKDLGPERPFEGRFGPVRASRDYTYHTRYCEPREHLQDKMLSRILDTSQCELHPGKPSCSVAPCVLSKRRPWTVFTAGGMGVGKSYTMRWAFQRGYFDTSRYVQVDPDRIKCMLPEMRELVKRDRKTAGTLAHEESAYIAEIAQEAALDENKNVLVDGSLRDWRWYEKMLTELQQKRPHYRIAIIKVTCSKEKMFERASSRGRQTGRDVPRELLEASYDAVDESVKRLTRFCDYVFEISTEEREPVLTAAIAGGTPAELGDDPWATFASAWRHEERKPT